MNIKIGSAPDSWGVWFSDDPKQIPWDRFLDEIADAGFTWTELGPYGYLPTELRLLEEQLWRRNLKVTGGFVMQPLEDPAAWPTIEREVLSAGELLAGLDAECLILIDDLYSDPFTGQTTTSRRLDYEGWCQLIDTVHRVSRLASEKCGLRMVFHPHAETHVEYEDQIERVLAESDASLVHLCLVVGHHAYRGGDPIAFMRKYHERIPYLHLKSVDPQKRQEVEDNGIPFATAVAQGMFCEPSKGTVDFIAFRDLLGELDYDGFAIVEQDMYPCPFDQPLPIAKRTREYLREIGLG